jgi:hypothetical protein
MLAQREKFDFIGGWCQMTTVRADRVETQMLHRWPDRIGERINPGIEEDALQAALQILGVQHSNASRE